MSSCFFFRRSSAYDRGAIGAWAEVSGTAADVGGRITPSPVEAGESAGFRSSPPGPFQSIVVSSGAGLVGELTMGAREFSASVEVSAAELPEVGLVVPEPVISEPELSVWPGWVWLLPVWPVVPPVPEVGLVVLLSPGIIIPNSSVS